jgi:mRNA interferase RelE/StbE
MAYRTKFNAKAQQDFDKLDRAVQRQIVKYLRKLEQRDNPRSMGDALTANLAGYWKYRVGDYRIVAEIQDEVLTVLAIAIGKRETIYVITDKRING